MPAQYDALINTPFGAIVFSAHEDQLVIELLAEAASQPNQTSSNPQVAKAYTQIMQYLERRVKDFHLAYTPYGTAYQQKVWQAIAAIPFGQTRTYGQLASSIGSGPRAVANACGANLLPLIIPCHRVVAQNGMGGFMQSKLDGLRVKKWLLKHEGVDVSQYE